MLERTDERKYSRCIVSDNPDLLPALVKSVILTGVDQDYLAKLFTQAVNNGALAVADVFLHNVNFVPQFDVDSIPCRHLDQSAVAQLYLALSIKRDWQKKNPQFEIPNSVNFFESMAKSIIELENTRGGEDELKDIYRQFLAMEYNFKNAYLWCQKQLETYTPSSSLYARFCFSTPSTVYQATTFEEQCAYFKNIASEDKRDWPSLYATKSLGDTIRRSAVSETYSEEMDTTEEGASYVSPSGVTINFDAKVVPTKLQF